MMNLGPTLSGATFGVNSAMLLLLLACVAAVQARAVRGAQRHHIQELCRRRGQPERSDEIVAGSEAIAFIAATIVVVTAVVATLLASRGLLAIPKRSSVLEFSAVAGWIGIVWLVLVVVPMLVTKFAGPWIVVATWILWHPLVLVLSPAVRMLGGAASVLGRAFGRRGQGASPQNVQDELRLVVDEAHREGRLGGRARDMIEGVMDLNEVRVSQIMTTRTRMISIPLAAPWEEAVQLASESGHTRLPVWPS